MPNNAYNIYPGGGDYLFYYQVNDAVFGFKADESKEGGGAGERLFSWVEADISSRGHGPARRPGGGHPPGV